MAEVMGVMLRRNPRKVFTIFVTWNLEALWRRIRKLQWPWAPYGQHLKRETLRDITTKIPKHTDEYLRSTKDIDPYAPEIVALAVKLGMQEKSKRAYAEAAYDWVKNNIVFAMERPPGGVVDVLRMRYGLCLNKMAVLVALMRVAGIPARFIEYKQTMGSGFMTMIIDEMVSGETGREIIQEMIEAQPLFTHGCIELYLEGKWLPMDLTWTDEEEVGLDMPLSQFGESPFGKWYNIIPDSITRSEDSPLPKLRLKFGIGIVMLRGLYDKLCHRFDRLREIGQKRLEEMGREAYIASKKKFYVPPPQLLSDNQ